MNAHLEKLNELYHSNKLVPFIGTGLSIPFNVPDWRDLIKHLSNKYVDKKLQPSINHYLDKFQYWEAVNLVLDFGNLTEEELQDEIVTLIKEEQQTISNNEEHNYHDIGTMNFSLYITTNYDHILNKYLDSNTFIPQILNKIEINSQYLLNTGEKRILHLHGNISDPYSIVITESKYKKLYNDNKYRKLFSLFSGTKTFLFLGFSFEDIFIRRLIKDHKEIFHGKHYILLNKPDFKKIREFQDEYGIKVISYDTTNSSHVLEIRKILDEIKKKTDSKHSVINLKRDKLIDKPYTREDKERLDNDLFCKKIRLEDIDKETLELAKIYFYRADEFIHKLRKYSLGKEIIESILEIVLIKHMNLFKKVYLKYGDSQKFIDSVHEVLEDIDYGRIEEYLEESIYPHKHENAGFIHILANDEAKDVWWGEKHIEGMIYNG